MNASLLGWFKPSGIGGPTSGGGAFVVRTDHYALKFPLDQRLSTIPQNHWVSKLFGYDFQVEYRQGRLNVVADALSRRDGEAPLLAVLLDSAPSLAALSVPAFQLFVDLQAELEDSDALRAR